MQTLAQHLSITDRVTKVVSLERKKGCSETCFFVLDVKDRISIDMEDFDEHALAKANVFGTKRNAAQGHC